ncbi:MAG: hypothetical protein NC548_22905 [Lachnospiraceae bacterium]|nr:hypothetical protein [Lachnospiraceae bacterium]
MRDLSTGMMFFAVLGGIILGILITYVSSFCALWLLNWGFNLSIPITIKTVSAIVGIRLLLSGFLTNLKKALDSMDEE